MNLFNAFGPVAPVKKTVSDAIAALTTTLNNLQEVVAQRTEAVELNERKVVELQNEITADKQEAEHAKAVQAKLKTLLDI